MPAKRSAARRRRSPHLHSAASSATFSLAVARRLPEIAWAILLATVALVWVVWLRGGLDPFSLPKVTVLWIGSATSLAAWFGSWIAQRPPLPRPRAMVPIGVFVVIVSVGVARSVSTAWSLVGRFDRYGGLFTLVACVVVAFLIVALTWARLTRLDALIAVAAATGVAEMLAVNLDRVGIYLTPHGSGISRSGYYPVGLFGNSNFSGAHLAITLPLLIALAPRFKNGWARAGFFVTIALQVLAIWISGSRGALVAAVVGVAVVGLFDRSLIPRLVTWVTTVGAIAAVLAVTVLVVGRWVGGEVSVADTGVLRSGSLVSRVDYWRGAVEMVRARPVLGWGPDSFELAFPAFGPRGLNRVGGVVVEEEGGTRDETGVAVVDEPHNILLAHAAGTGLLGAAAYAATVVYVLFIAIRARRELDSTGGRVLAAFSAALAAYLVQGLLSIDVVPLVLLGWVSIGAIISVADPGVRRARLDAATLDRVSACRDHQPGLLAKLTMGVLLVVVVTVSVVAVRPLLADRRLAKVVADPVPTASRLVPQLDSAIGLDPWSSELRYRAAQTATTVGATATLPGDGDALRRYAIEQFDQALERAPGDGRYLRAKAAVLRQQGEAGDVERFADAEAIYVDLANSDPYNVAVPIDRARNFVAWRKATGRDDLIAPATEAIESAASLDEPFPKGWYLIGKVRWQLGDRSGAIDALDRALELQSEYPEARQLRDEIESSPTR